jgi:phage tail P2-like protein
MSVADLLPPNATCLEKYAAEATDLRLPITLADHWNPERCPKALLPWLAWACAVDHWDSNWSEVIQRQCIADSITIHRQKGTVAAIERVLNTLGVQAELQEWFEYDGKPYTFQLTAWVNFTVPERFFLCPATYRQLQQAIDHVKPIRSHYQFRVGVTGHTGLGVVGKITACNMVQCSMAIKAQP